ncbi:MAG TPA: GMC family oxidoreductase, partial [Acidimicrobiia bacterium]
LEVFTAVVDTILPAVPGTGPVWTTPGQDLGLAEELPRVYASLPHDQDRQDLRRLLTLLGTKTGGLVLFRRPESFAKMSHTRRADAFRAMETSRVGLVRKGARALKTLTALLWVTTDQPATPPAVWAEMGYPGPAGPAPQVPKPIPVETITGDTTLETDVVVVGSGAGGGTVAGVLSAAGISVIVLERGGYRNESDFSHLEADAYETLYLDGALGSSADGSTLMLAGATLGGGTVVNYTTSFPTPVEIREEWDRVAGFDHVFGGESFERSTQAVLSRLDVNQDNGSPSTRDRLMEKGLRGLGWHVGKMPRNAVGCTESDCGYCTMGCRIGAKRSTLATYLQDAAGAGARIITEAEVQLVETEDGRATGVIARVGAHTVRVRSRAVVLAAGALSTPAVLLRSGVGGDAAGRFLRLHPVTALWGRFDDNVEPWSGVLQTRYSDQFSNLDGRGHGFKFETAPVHPLFPSAFIGWDDGPSFKRDVLGLGHLNVAGILLRDRDHGRVIIRKDGTPVWKYKISRFDQGHVRVGVRRAAELLAESGAREVITSSVRPVRWIPGSGSLESFMAEADAIGYGPNRTSYFSFHQMGSARMGSDPATSVVDDGNETHGTRGLYVMDGSCFPTASGVNPMLSIVAIAHRGATLLAQRLT